MGKNHQNNKQIPAGWDADIWASLPPQDKAYFSESSEAKLARRYREQMEIILFTLSQKR
jgi:hypothetical protein